MISNLQVILLVLGFLIGFFGEDIWKWYRRRG
jgi:hypothetical protein